MARGEDGRITVSGSAFYNDPELTIHGRLRCRRKIGIFIFSLLNWPVFVTRLRKEHFAAEVLAREMRPSNVATSTAASRTSTWTIFHVLIATRELVERR